MIVVPIVIHFAKALWSQTWARVREIIAPLNKEFLESQRKHTIPELVSDAQNKLPKTEFRMKERRAKHRELKELKDSGRIKVENIGAEIITVPKEDEDE